MVHLNKAIYEIFESPLLEYIMRIVIMSDWGMCPLAVVLKPKSVDEVMIQATARNVSIGGVKVKV